MNVQRWPIDYTALNKGDIIPVQRIEQITGKTFGTSAYDLALLAFKDRVQAQLRDIGKPWTLCTEKGSVKILTDPEAVIYNNVRQVQSRRQQLRNFALESAVDVGNLDEDQRKEYERNHEVNGKFVQAMANVRKELRLTATTRTIPGLPA